MKKRLITDFLEIPAYPSDIGDEGKNIPEFYRKIDSDEVKQAALFTIINELREVNVDDMTDPQCRAILAKCQGILSVMDFSARVKRHLEIDEEQEEMNEDLSHLRG